MDEGFEDFETEEQEPAIEYDFDTESDMEEFDFEDSEFDDFEFEE